MPLGTKDEKSVLKPDPLPPESTGRQEDRLKILSFGDLHLGVPGCDEDIWASACEIGLAVYKEKPDLAVITGDLYDTLSAPEERNRASDIVRSIANHCPTIIIKGNHDGEGDLRILGDLKAEHWIKVVEFPDCLDFTDAVRGKIALHFLPWMTKAQFIASRTPGYFGITDTSKAVSELALMYLRARIASVEATSHVLFGHLMISGARAENHQPLLGEGITFGHMDLQELGFDAGAFGHIHLAQAFGDRGQFRYNGSIAALNYGESAKTKTFSILNTDNMEFTVYPLECRQRITFDARWSGHLEFTEVPNNEIAGNWVRVKLLVDEGFNAEDGRKALHEYLDLLDPHELKIEVQTKPKDAVRCEAIATAVRATEKLIAYWEATGTTPEEPLRSEMLQQTEEIEAECLLEQKGAAA